MKKPINWWALYGINIWKQVNDRATPAIHKFINTTFLKNEFFNMRESMRLLQHAERGGNHSNGGIKVGIETNKS